MFFATRRQISNSASIIDSSGFLRAFVKRNGNNSWEEISTDKKYNKPDISKAGILPSFILSKTFHFFDSVAVYVVDNYTATIVYIYNYGDSIVYKDISNMTDNKRELTNLAFISPDSVLFTTGSSSNQEMYFTADGFKTIQKILNFFPNGITRLNYVKQTPLRQGFFIASARDNDLLVNGSAFSTDLGRTWTHNQEGFSVDRFNIFNAYVIFGSVLNPQRKILKLNRLTSIKENEIDKRKVKIFQNPVNEYINVNTEDEMSYIATVLDINGKPFINSFKNSTSINVSSLASGTYILKIEHQNSTSYFRFVKF